MPKEMNFMERERTPIEIVLYAIYLYLSALSLRQTSRTLKSIGIKRSHEAIRKWVQKFSTHARQLIAKTKARVVIVDETAINIGGKRVWLWVAIEPERRALISMYVSETRNALVAYSFLSELRLKHGVRHVITDGASWYCLAANWARVSREVVHGGVRSYVERFICSVKDRLRGFDCYFPSPSGALSSALKLLYAWAGFYNYARLHLSFSEPPIPLPGATELSRLVQVIVRG